MWNKKKRAFSSYKTLKDLRSVLKKYGIDINNLTDIPQFKLDPFTLTNEDKELQQCIRDIKRKLGNLGTLMADSNETVRREYISAILHAALYIVKRITDKDLTLVPQLEVTGEENTGRVNYVIKAPEELICITESKKYAINIGFIQNVLQCTN